MSEFTNTAALIGDNALTDSIIDRSITEIADNLTTKLRAHAFQNCTLLKSVQMTSVQTAGNDAFAGCTSLEAVSLPELVDGGKFLDCTSLESICLPKLASIPGSFFWGCKALKKADFPAVTTLGTFCFYLCNQLTTLILRSPTVCAMPTANTIPSSANVYVPAALVEEYKAATNWSAIASRIFAIEDYPDITGGAT